MATKPDEKPATTEPAKTKVDPLEKYKTVSESGLNVYNFREDA
ncbi:hypothetical protein [Dyella silvatica]|nr:hypothetical protein [Dyella silvatica]